MFNSERILGKDDLTDLLYLEIMLRPIGQLLAILNKRYLNYDDFFNNDRIFAFGEAKIRLTENRNEFLAKWPPSSLYRFHVNPQDFAEMYRHQNGLCAICGNPPSKKGFVVDHNHKHLFVESGVLALRLNPFDPAVWFTDVLQFQSGIVEEWFW